MERRPHKILCAIDFSEFTERILSFGALLGNIFSAKLYLAHATVDVKALLEHHETTIDVETLQQTNIREARKQLAVLAKDLPLPSEIIVSQGAPADTIAKLAFHEHADIVISATHGKSGFKRLVLGSVTEKLLKTLHCPLLVLPAHEHGSRLRGGSDWNIGKILVGCDFSPDSKLAVEHAHSLTQALQAELYLVHVIKPALYQDKREVIADLRGNLERQLGSMVPEGCRAEAILLEGEPSSQLMNFAEQRGIDMIILGIHGHTLLEKLLVGSTTDRVIRQAKTPVLAVRHI